MSGNEYVIREIFHPNQSFLMTKFGESHMCSPDTYRLAFARLPFSYVHSNINLCIFFNCSAPFTSEYLRYSFGCATNNLRHHSLTLFSDDPRLAYVRQSGQCEASEFTPVWHIGNGSLNTTMMPREYIEEFLSDGFYSKWNASMRDECAVSGGRCGFNYTLSTFMCFCPDQPHHRWCSNSTDSTSIDSVMKAESNSGRKIAIGLSTGAGSMIVVILFFVLYGRRSVPQILSWKKKTRISIDFEAFLKNHMSHYPKRYNFKDVKTMTKSFKDKLGQGGYGTVFKGTLNDGQFVAVKILTETKGNGEEFINEVASISRTSHVNIVGLLGYCFDGLKRALIYEFMPNGSLDKYIYGEKSSEEYSQLEWETLYQIAVGTARGLEYLHRGCSTRILHFDIKPHNILLDKDFCPKISDFGLARLCPTKESVISMLGARGTAGYIAPEVFCRSVGGISHKSDVYSYGMMILEMVGRRKNVDIGVNHTSEIYFPSWIYKRIELDEDLGLHRVVTQTAGELTKKMILVGLWCIQTNPQDRPSMHTVLEMLESSLQVLSLPPKPYLCSPPREPTGSSVN